MSSNLPPILAGEAPPTLQASHHGGSIEALLAQTRAFAEEIASRPQQSTHTAPRAELVRLQELGVMRAALARDDGGLGLGLEPGTQRPLLELLAVVGSADLALGRILEGHINALLLIHRFATAAQRASAAEDCRSGRLFGVWNTGTPELMQLQPEADGTFLLQGGKTFATGAEFVDRPIVTAELPGSGWRMTLPRMESSVVSFDRSFWHPLGMESTESYAVDFTGTVLCRSDLIGGGGDFYRDPLFRGGAVRFAAVQAGAVLRLHTALAQWLREQRRSEDAYQLARLGEVAILAQQAVLWVERSAQVAEECLFREDPASVDRMVACANMTRLAIERIATQTMQLVTVSVGAHGLLGPQPFERILRNLTMYLRQPAPDQALRSVGEDSIRKASRRSLGASDSLWTVPAAQAGGDDSLPPAYFDRIYEEHADPWNFETSPYERDKYSATIASLPRARYGAALEIGCSIGVLTASLAQHADTLLALDVSERALGKAAARCDALPGVRFAQLRFPQQVPAGTFDLVVVSEIAYYWSRAMLAHAIETIAAMQRPGANLVLVHWTPKVHDYPLTGDEVHDLWISRPEWRLVHSMREELFRLDVLERVH